MLNNFIARAKSIHFGSCKNQEQHLKTAVLSLTEERQANEKKISELILENCDLKLKVRELEANEIIDLSDGF